MAINEDGTIILRGTAHGGTPDRLSGPLEDVSSLTGDGTIVNLINHTIGNKTGWTAGSGARTYGVLLIFPELRDIDGSWAVHDNLDDGRGILHSADSSNGLNGTWTSQTTVVGEVFSGVAVPITSYRDHVFAWSQTAKRAMQLFGFDNGVTGGKNYRDFEIYGEISSGETPDRLLYIDDRTGLEFGTPHDYSNRPRGMAQDVSMRIKNNSGTLTASTIDVSRGRTGTAEDDATSWWEFDNGAGFAATFEVASLAAGIEDTFVTRLVVPGAAVPGLYEIWMEFDTASWA